MGVSGLSTYVDNHQSTLLKQYLLHNSNLVIDGHSVCAALHSSLKYYSAFGGDYDLYGVRVRRFFVLLERCKVKPYIIFDGSFEPKKLKRAYTRLQSRIREASKRNPCKRKNPSFPLLFRDVFKEVLLDLNIPFTVCELEADKEIAAMAKSLNCPVLSSDSDFFIYNVLYIPYWTMKQSAVRIDNHGRKTKNERMYGLKCQIYNANGFNGVSNELLPLLSTLLGNDYVDYIKNKVFEGFFSQLALLEDTELLSEQQRRIHALLKWLKYETLESAIRKVLESLKSSKKYKIGHNIIKQNFESYNTTACDSLKYFEITEQITTPPNTKWLKFFDSNEIGSDADDASSENETSESVMDNIENDFKLRITDWFVNGVRNKTIPKAYLELYTLHLYFYCPQAENYTMDDPFLCTLPIIRYAFDILTDFSVEYFTYVGRDACQLKYTETPIGRHYATSRIINSHFYELTECQLQDIFNHFISVKLPNVDMSLIRQMPDNLQLFFLSILWWSSNCKPTITQVYSLFICYIMLDIVDEKVLRLVNFKFFYDYIDRTARCYSYQQRCSLSTFKKNNTLFLSKEKVGSLDCVLAASSLYRDFDINHCIGSSFYDVRKVHSFAKFQCCLQQLNNLNTLCGSPFKSTQYSKCYNGTFAYNIELRLRLTSNPDDYIYESLMGANDLSMFFNSLCTIFNDSNKNMLDSK